jgi:hypothetical protein
MDLEQQNDVFAKSPRKNANPSSLKNHQNTFF